MTNKIDVNKFVPRERWGEFFDQFSDGNRVSILRFSPRDPLCFRSLTYHAL